MSLIGRREFFDPDGNRYILDLAFDDAAMMEDSLAVSVNVTRLPASGGPPDYVEAKVTLDLAEEMIIVAMPGVDEFRIPLYHSELVAEAETEDGFEMDQFWQTATNASGREDLWETIIEYMPAGDPLLGCVVKAGVSTSVGQIIACNAEVERSGDRPRLKAILRCLRSNGVSMLRRAAVRTFKCWIRLGF